MATIDSSIALGVKPVQIQDPINQFARQQELSVNMMKANEMQRAMQEEQQVRNFLRGADLSKPETRAELSRFGKTGLAYGTALAAQEKAGLETTKLKGDINKQKLEETREAVKSLDFNPSDSNFKAYLEDAVLKGRMTPEQAEQEFAAIAPLNTDQRRAFVKNRALTAEKLYSDLTTRRGQDISAQTTRRGQDLQYDPDLQAKIAGAKKREEGKVAQEIQGEIDVKANRKALATAGYDPVTGTDNISKLIQDSTGSFIGAGTNLAGRVFGVSTKGAQSIAELKAFESKLTQDILGGKLGAGISNTDREFIVQAIGDIANQTLPVETRQAAWDSVKERMRVAGMVEAPQSNINVPGLPQVKVPGGAAAPAAKPSLDDIFKPKK
jgi:hypothetical protein